MIDDNIIDQYKKTYLLEKYNDNKNYYHNTYRLGTAELINGDYRTFTKEYELLKYLASNPERVFTREHLLTKVWDYDYIGGARTVDVHVRRLRMKIERHGIRIISTVRGVGYKFGE